MIANIIKIPERCPSECVGNYWKIYEESYKNKGELFTFVNDDTFSISKKEKNQEDQYIDPMSKFLFDIIGVGDKRNTIIDDVNQDIEKIYDVRYNFYKVDSKYILSKMLLSYYEIFFDSNQTMLKNVIENLYKNGTVDNFIKIYLRSCIDSDISLINKFSNELNLVLESIDNEVSLINFQYYFNKLLNVIDKIDNNDKYLKKNIISSISNNYIDKVKNFINNNGLSYLSDISNQSIFKNLFSGNLLIKYFDDQVMYNFNRLIINKMITFSEDKLLDNDYAYKLFDVIKIITTINHTLNVKNPVMEIDNEELNKFSNYICASLYFFLNKKNIINVCNIINFHYNNLPNKLDFLTFYKYHLQWRSTNKLNYEYENKAYQYIIKLFVEDEYKKIIDNIKNSLDDIFLSEHMNKEINDLSITVQTPEFKDIKFDTKKIDVFITSNVIWQDIKAKNNYKNVYKSKEIELYSTLISNYYDKKYTCSDQKRLLDISYDESFVDISLGNSNIRLPVTYLSVLEIIGSSNDSLLEDICRKVNLDQDKVNKIMKDLKINNIIIEESNKLNFNNSFLTANAVINMMQINSNNNIDIISEEISYDKDMLIDSVISKVCKKKYVSTDNKDYAYVSYGRLIMVVRGELQKFFIPGEKNIRARLSRLVTLGYLSEDKKCNKFIYIT